MTDSNATPDATPPTGPGANVDRDDVLCIMCSYALRGLDDDARCPECGTPVQRSVRGDLLRYSSDAYLQSIERGALLIVASAVAAVVLSTIAAIDQFGGGWPQAIGFAAAMGLSGVVIVELVGWWRFSTPDPAAWTERSGSRARWWVRCSVVAMAVAVALDGAVFAAIQFGATRELLIAENVLGVVEFVASIVRFFATMSYVIWLAPRIPDPDLERMARTFRWLCPLLSICLPVAIILYLILIYRVRNAVAGLRLDPQRQQELAAMEAGDGQDQATTV